MRCVKFLLTGRVGHFARAEYNAGFWDTYPIPPRTSLMGLVGAILGLDKDEPQVKLAGSLFAVSGPIPQIHYHMANMRKNRPPTIKSYTLASLEKHRDETKVFKVFNTRIRQAWLFEPKFVIYASLPGDFHDEFVTRIKTEQYRYAPVLGKSGMFAQLELLGEEDVQALPEGHHDVVTVVRRTPSTKLVLTEPTPLQELVMPWDVSPDRVFTFSPDPYLVQRDGDPIPVHTPDAHQFEDQSIMFL